MGLKKNIIIQGDTFSFEYPLTLDLVNFTDQISNLRPYVYNSYRDNSVEVDCTYFPTFVEYFYSTLLINGKLAEPIDFAKSYIEDSFEKKDNSFVWYKIKNVEKKYYKSGIISHIVRSYPSFIRDFHFFLRLKNNKKITKVTYNLEADLKDKCDIRLLYNDYEFDLRLFYKTQASLDFYEKKHKKKDAIETKKFIITMPIDKDTAHNLDNGYQLYTRNHLISLMSKMDDIIGLEMENKVPFRYNMI